MFFMRRNLIAEIFAIYIVEKPSLQVGFYCRKPIFKKRRFWSTFCKIKCFWDLKLKKKKSSDPTRSIGYLFTDPYDLCYTHGPHPSGSR
jgi:hypothetical protein